MNKKRTFGILVGAVALSWMSLSWGAGVYKWVDEKGVTHFGEKPPSPGVGEKIKISAPSPSSTPAPEKDSRSTQKAPAASAAKPSEAETAEAKAQADIIKKNCETYAANLKVLKESARIREQASDGQVKMLTDEEKQARIQQAEQFIAEKCQPQKQ